MINAGQEYASHNAKCIETLEKALVCPSSLLPSLPLTHQHGQGVSSVRCTLLPEFQRETQSLLLFKDSLYSSPLMEGLPQPWGKGAHEEGPTCPSSFAGGGLHSPSVLSSVPDG